MIPEFNPNWVRGRISIKYEIFLSSIVLKTSAEFEINQTQELRCSKQTSPSLFIPLGVEFRKILSHHQVETVLG